MYCEDLGVKYSNCVVGIGGLSGSGISRIGFEASKMDGKAETEVKGAVKNFIWTQQYRVET
ncbi:uncharacterized protein DS421_4g108660 [Arachis hypogaea]|nr:uncharacterized protein DS421_4g108660 [Arachis hypogaea]